MTKESNRQLKVAKLIQKDLGEIFQKEMMSAFNNAFITVTGVKISPDLAVARVQLSFLKVDDPQAMVEDINKRKSEVRKILGNKIGKQVRIVPDLFFYLDDSAEYASRIDKLLSGLNIPKEEGGDK